MLWIKFYRHLSQCLNLYVHISTITNKFSILRWTLSSKDPVFVIEAFKVDANDSIFQFGTKSHQLFLLGILLMFEDARKGRFPPCQKLETEFQTESYQKKSGSKFGMRWKDLSILLIVNCFECLRLHSPEKFKATVKYFLYEREANFSFRNQQIFLKHFFS